MSALSILGIYLSTGNSAILQPAGALSEIPPPSLDVEDSACPPPHSIQFSCTPGIGPCTRLPSPVFGTLIPSLKTHSSHWDKHPNDFASDDYSEPCNPGSTLIHYEKFTNRPSRPGFSIHRRILFLRIRSSGNGVYVFIVHVGKPTSGLCTHPV